MRKYIRHPSDIPVEINVRSADLADRNLLDVSEGGVAFASTERLAIGTEVSVCIRTVRPPFRARAVVTWCLKRREHYDVGVRFKDVDDAFRARMVEQVCHIEHYKKKVLETEGRTLTGAQAALEWIARFAADFPGSGGGSDRGASR